jgi:TrpR-related protein YerC/YecD
MHNNILSGKRAGFRSSTLVRTTGSVYDAGPMKRRFTEDAWRKEPWFKNLCIALRSNKTDEDMANFLRDIATLSELQAWSERLEVARLLGKGLSYRQVAKETGASTTTVTRVAHFLENGEGGYRRFLNVHRHHRMLPKPATEAEVTDAPEPVEQERIAEEKPLPKPVTALQKYL